MTSMLVEPQFVAGAAADVANIGSQIGYTTKHRDISWRFLAIGLLYAYKKGVLTWT